MAISWPIDGDFNMNRIASGTLGLAAFALSAGSGFAGPVTIAAQQQGQLQGQQQQTSSSATSGAISGSASIAKVDSSTGNNTSINFNSPAIPTDTTQTINNVPNVYAPGLA